MPAAGTPSEKVIPPFDPFVTRTAVRLTTVYATTWRCETHQFVEVAKPPGEFFRLGRLGHFYEISQRQVPRIIAHHDLDESSLSFQRWSDGGAVQAARVWYFAVPSNQILVALTLDVQTSLVGSIPLLEDLYYAAISVAGTPLADSLAATMSGLLTGQELGDGFLPERHQLVFTGIPDSDALPNEDQVQRVIYRADLPCRPEHSSIQYPAELNRRATTMCALGPYVSVVGGQQDYMENTILLSTVQTVSSAARLREIRERAYECVRLLRASDDHDQAVRERRIILEDIADSLRELELELSFSVEATRDLGMLVPSLRVENYHNALYASMNLADRAQTTGHMLERLRNAIAAELTSVQSVEERADDARRVRTVVAVTFVTTVGGTLSLLFGFFGINATQVDGSRSIFDMRYIWIYALIGFLIIGALGIFIAMRAHERRQTHHHRRRRRRSVWVPSQRTRPVVEVPVSVESDAQA